MISETNKVFVLNIETGLLVCELDSNSTKYQIDANDHKIEAYFSCKNFQLFLKGLYLVINRIIIKFRVLNILKYFEAFTEDGHAKLVCHSLRLVSPLDDYLSTSYSLLQNCLPINGLLSERIANLMKYRYI